MRRNRRAVKKSSWFSPSGQHAFFLSFEKKVIEKNPSVMCVFKLQSNPSVATCSGWFKVSAEPTNRPTSTVQSSPTHLPPHSLGSLTILWRHWISQGETLMLPASMCDCDCVIDYWLWRLMWVCAVSVTTSGSTRLTPSCATPQLTRPQITASYIVGPLIAWGPWPSHVSSN